MNNELYVLDRYFPRVVILSLPGQEDRAQRAVKELEDKCLSFEAQVVRAVDGRVSPPSDWWQAGAGAWGCMQSHYRVVQDALLDGLESLLVLEDDCIWQNGAAAMVEEFMAQVPDDWGQIYFGGQHRNARRPSWVDGKPAVLQAASVHRTHAYAIHKRAMPGFLKHVLYAPDYIAARERDNVKRHVDHQLEVAHQRGAWTVYCPSWWLAGQGANHSSINNKDWNDQWWHLSWREEHRRMPVVICDRDPAPEEMKRLHFGKHLLAHDPTIDEGVAKCRVASDLIRIMEAVAEEALGCQRLPALRANPDQEKWLRQKWLGPVLTLALGPDLAALCDFPASKVIRHPWINPDQPPRIEVVEPSASTEATETAERRPMVHQVWIGPNDLPPRLEAYCDTMRHAFGTKHDYKLWREPDMEALAVNAVLPQVVRGGVDCNIGFRADVVRLEILRQHGGIYWDTDFEALRPDLEPLFGGLRGFAYADQKPGSPANGFMAAGGAHDPFVEFFLRRVAARVPSATGDPWKTVSISGPGALTDCLTMWVVVWNPCGKLVAGNEEVAVSYAGNTIHAYHQTVIYPYHYQQGSWATFKPEDFPLAWTAHHWEGAWHRPN